MALMKNVPCYANIRLSTMFAAQDTANHILLCTRIGNYGESSNRSEKQKKKLKEKMLRIFEANIYDFLPS